LDLLSQELPPTSPFEVKCRPALRGEMLENRLEIVKIDWLHEVKIESGFFGAPNVFVRAEAGDRDGLDRPLSPGLRDDLVTASIGQADVAQEHIDFSRGEDFFCAANILRSYNVMTKMGEQARQDMSRVAVVFYEQDPQRL
jgi:hypothetical protein